MITVLAGGVGAARFLTGLVQVVDPSSVTAVVNTGDDFTLHGLRISPDLDTVTYTLAGVVNQETGWGREKETWTVMDALAGYGGQTWFRLGDRDLAPHLFRTQRLAEGAPLSEVTAQITAAWGLRTRLLPMTDDEVATRITVDGEGEVGFQHYFVFRRHAVTTEAVRFAGIEEARPAPGVIEAIGQAAAVVIAPSNPVVSIDPILGVPGVREALAARTGPTVAVSPLIGGKALKGPADRLMTELGLEASAAGVARHYSSVVDALVIDIADEADADAVRAQGVEAVVAPTLMHDSRAAARLAAAVLEAAGA